jgi:hypothetical protein
MSDGALGVEMREPGAANGLLTEDASRRGSLDDRRGKPPLAGEIAPSRRIRPDRLSLGPTFRDRPVEASTALRPVRRRETWRQSGEFPQALAGMAEGQAGLELLHQSESVASSMANDHSGSRPNFFASQAKAVRHRREQETGARKTTASGGVCAVPPTERRRKHAVRRELPKTCSGRSSFARSRIYLGHENRTE